MIRVIAGAYIFGAVFWFSIWTFGSLGTHNLRASCGGLVMLSVLLGGILLVEEQKENWSQKKTTIAWFLLSLGAWTTIALIALPLTAKCITPN